MPPTNAVSQSARLNLLKQLRTRVPRNTTLANKRFYVRSETGWNYVPGIRKRMERAFFTPPKEKALKNAQRKARRGIKKPNRRNLSDREIDALRHQTSESDGLERGRQVHEELELYCNSREAFNKAAKETTEYIFNMALAKKARDHPYSRPKGPNVPPHRRGIDPPKPARVIHSYTFSIIRLLEKWKLTPVVAEFALCDPDAGYATAIDLICLSSRGKIWAIELKTGYDATFTTATRKMNAPLDRFLNNSALAQAILQIYIPVQTLRRKFGVRARGCVILVNKEGAKIQPIPENMMAAGEELYPKIVREMQKLDE